MQDRRISVRMVSEVVGISIGTVDTILPKDLKLHKERRGFSSGEVISGGSIRIMPHATSQRW